MMYRNIKQPIAVVSVSNWVEKKPYVYIFVMNHIFMREKHVTWLYVVSFLCVLWERNKPIETEYNVHLLCYVINREKISTFLFWNKEVWLWFYFYAYCLILWELQTKRSEAHRRIMKVTETTQSGCHWLKPDCRITLVNIHMWGRWRNVLSLLVLARLAGDAVYLKCMFKG